MHSAAQYHIMERRSNISKPGSRKGSRTGSSMTVGSHARFSRSFLGSKSNLLTASKRNLATESMKFSKPQAQVFDEHGKDVTPLSLLEPDHIKRNQSTAYGVENGVPNDSLFQHSIYGTGPGSTSFSQPFSRSVFSSSVTDLGTMSMRDSVGEELITARATSNQKQDISLTAITIPRKLTEINLDLDVTITLSETKTIWMLDIPGTCVALDSPESDEVKRLNESYRKLVGTRAGNDRFSERSMQTINNDLKIKQNQTEDVVKMDAGSTATTWDMYDMYEALKQAEGKSDEETLEELSSRATSRMVSGTSHRAPTAMGQQMDSTMPGESVFLASIITEASVGLTHPSKKSEKDNIFDPTLPSDHPILKSNNLRDNLRMMERAVTQNIYQSKQALYRKLLVVVDPDVPSLNIKSLPLSNPHLEKLWSFSCPLTRRRNVTCMAWNKLNIDIVAVGYGDFGFRGTSTGLVCCWSLKNPQYPERIFNAPSGITSVSFSQNHPNLLAAGLYNGVVVLFNVRGTAHESVLDSRDALHKHSAPVWQVRWVAKERAVGENKAENLVSISVDGKVLQWSIRKGFESMQLMKLKRMVKPKQQSKRVKTKQTPSRINPSNPVPSNQPGAVNVGGEAYISQHAPGMGFDFSSRDSNIYLACTEEGYIHKCSCSYNEQFLETYTGHTGPVYRVTWSPFVPTLFLSCSADWSVKLWSQDSTTPLHSFHAAQKSIFDVCWSPSDSRIFGCVSEGRIEIWNLEHNILDPMILHKPNSGIQQTCITFAQETQVVLVGDEMGAVSVYLIRNLPAAPNDQEEALLRAVSVSQKDL
ncbi:dynein axonemal intermediate chain 4-like isoform X2 [Halichondria panicea]|uniref:dynein axonemal intermediate chain 4-like isoform X2 n=1 Tax=Halichondria panicea TaxID=6063 RepID=UPI00312BB4D3